jgi:hypothetical protein
MTSDAVIHQVLTLLGMLASGKYFQGPISIRGILNQPTLEFLGVIAAPLLLSDFQGHLDNHMIVPNEGLGDSICCFLSFKK